MIHSILLKTCIISLSMKQIAIYNFLGKSAFICTMKIRALITEVILSCTVMWKMTTQMDVRFRLTQPYVNECMDRERSLSSHHPKHTGNGGSRVGREESHNVETYQRELVRLLVIQIKVLLLPGTQRVVPFLASP